MSKDQMGVIKSTISINFGYMRFYFETMHRTRPHIDRTRAVALNAKQLIFCNHFTQINHEKGLSSNETVYLLWLTCSPGFASTGAVRRDIQYERGCTRASAISHQKIGSSVRTHARAPSAGASCACGCSTTSTVKGLCITCQRCSS